MDPTQKNNLDNAMPSEGVVGNAVGADNSVSSGMPMGVGNSVSASAPVNAGRFSALTGAKRYNSSMNAGQFANPARGAVGMVGQTIGSVGQPTFAMGSNQPIVSSDAGMDMGNPGMSLNPSMEGVAVNNEGGSKTKKLWIAGSVIGAILVVCIAVVAVVMNSGGGANSPSDSNSEINRQYGISNYKEAVNAFANYIMFDRNSTENISGIYDSTMQYAIWEAAAEENVDFFNTAKGLFDNMVAWVDGAITSGDNIKGMGYVLLENYMDAFEFYYLLNTVSDTTFNDLLKKYVNDGQEAALDLVDEFCDPFINSSSDLAKRYGRLNKKIGLLDVSMIRSAADNSCITGEVIDMGCTSKFDNSEEVLERNSAKQMSDDIARSARKKVIDGCYDLIESLNGVSKSETDMEAKNV